MHQVTHLLHPFVHCQSFSLVPQHLQAHQLPQVVLAGLRSAQLWSFRVPLKYPAHQFVGSSILVHTNVLSTLILSFWSRYRLLLFTLIWFYRLFYHATKHGATYDVPPPAFSCLPPLLAKPHPYSCVCLQGKLNLLTMECSCTVWKPEKDQILVQSKWGKQNTLLVLCVYCCLLLYIVIIFALFIFVYKTWCWKLVVIVVDCSHGD